MNGTISGKRIISLRSYFKENREDRRITLISLFRRGDEYKEAVEQLVNVLLDLTVTDDPDKKPVEFILAQYLTVYERTCEEWVKHLTGMMISCKDCDKPTWKWASIIIASVPLDRVYCKNICVCNGNLRSYCSMTPNHLNIYFALIEPGQYDKE